MNVSVTRLCFVWCVLLAGCPGVWGDPCLETRPTPELACEGSLSEREPVGEPFRSPDDAVEATVPNIQGLGEEECNGLDDDADGMTDEGCSCSGAVQDCFGWVGTACGQGEQPCEGGRWVERCDGVGEPLAEGQESLIELEIVSPTTLYSDSQGIQVKVQVQAPCPHVSVPTVWLRLSGQGPLMWHDLSLADDGVTPDLEAQDTYFEGTLPNIFGPGVGEQEISIEATAVLEETSVSVSHAIDYLPTSEP